MPEPIVNPFKYGGVVGEDTFCNRQRELRELRRAAQNGERLLVYGERRMGKTSLLRRALAGLPARSFTPIYVDVWATSDEASLARAIATATVRAAATRAAQLLETAKAVVRHLQPSVSVDPAGNPVVQFGTQPGASPEPVLEDALDAPARLAATRGKRVVVVFDEVQRLAEYGSDVAERLVRSRTQAHEGVAYFFAGSRKHLIQQMFMERGRPLYQAAGHYPIGPISESDWAPFIGERFSRAGRAVDDGVIGALCAHTEGHPYYTQHLAHALWEITPAGGKATHEQLNEAVALVLGRLSYPFTVIWEGLTPNQRTLLRGLVAGGGDAQLFSASFLQGLGMAPSSASRSIQGLVQSDVLDRDESGYVMSDRFFRLWIERSHAA